jgi:hypothetical protein
MPKREDATYRRHEDEPRYCSVCQRYFGPRDWAIHPHNPERGRRPSLGQRLLRVLGLRR